MGLGNGMEKSEEQLEEQLNKEIFDGLDYNLEPLVKGLTQTLIEVFGEFGLLKPEDFLGNKEFIISWEKGELFEGRDLEGNTDFEMSLKGINKDGDKFEERDKVVLTYENIKDKISKESREYLEKARLELLRIVIEVELEKTERGIENELVSNQIDLKTSYELKEFDIETRVLFWLYN